MEVYLPAGAGYDMEVSEQNEDTCADLDMMYEVFFSLVHDIA